MFLTTNNPPHKFGIIKNGTYNTPAFTRLKSVQLQTQNGEQFEYVVHPDFQLKKLIETHQLTEITWLKVDYFWQRNWDEDLDGEF